MGGGASKPAEKDRRASKGGKGSDRRSSTKKKSKDPKVVLEAKIEAGDDKGVAALLDSSPALVNESLDDDGMRALQVARVFAAPPHRWGFCGDPAPPPIGAGAASLRSCSSFSNLTRF